jgi:hypothetical protein
MISDLKEHKVDVFGDDEYTISCAGDNSILSWLFRNQTTINSHCAKDVTN